ncbi:MAG: M14 family zinc carboxypeptidase [Tenuifilaceae bacterium]
MRKFSFVILLFAISTWANAQTTEFYFRFIEPNKNTINTTITSIISIDGISHDTVYAYANADELKKFEKLGYKYTLLPHPSSLNTKAWTMATTIDQMVNWDRYPTYEVYRAMMKKFEQDYPTLCKLDSFGTTPNGRKLYAVKLSDNVTTNEPEVEFFYTSTMHGDEATGYILMLRLIDYLLKNYSTDSRIAAMLNSMAIYINPNSNPDGTYRGGNSTVSGATRYNANNVDLNRNFPDPRAGNHPDGYSWQPENVAMMNYVSSRHFTLAANFHGGAELANYPWDTWNSSQRLHPDNNWYIKLSRTYADSLQANSPAGYFTGQDNGISNGGDWYVISGGRQDYMNWWQHCREVTMEISYTKLPSSDLLPNYWNYNKAGLLVYIESALKGINGTVKNTSGDPLKAKVFVNNHDKDSSYIYSSSTTGYYSRPIEPGTWQVMYSSPGYISQIHSVDISNWESKVVNDIVLIASQPVTLTGTITSTSTLGLIQNARVELVGTTISPVYTNDQGVYSFSSIPQNIYSIKVSKPGYSGKIQQSEVTSSVNTINFSLDPADYEGFEGGLPVEFSCSGGNWFNDYSFYFEGSSSIRSAAIGSGGITTMEIPLNITSDGTISFARKVSSESGYDYLRFFIDGVEKQKWSGEQNWSTVSYAVTTGSHIFKWTYSKDLSSTAGSDCGWIDSIVFPPTLQNVTFTANLNGNPCSYVPIEFNNQTIETNTSGQAIFQVGRGVDKPYSATIASLTPITGKVDVQYSAVNKTLDFTGNPNYTVTFEVKSNSVAVQNANVNFNSVDILTSASGNAVFTSVTRGTNYSYTISITGYQTATGQVNVLDNKTIYVDLVPNATPVFTVTFDVKHSSAAIANATVIFNGAEQQTSATGIAIFTNIQQGTGYSYSVVKSGYKTITGQTDISADKTISIELAPVFTVSFSVKHIGSPIANANVNFDGKDQLTATDGTTSFTNILSGNGYTYTVSKLGYKSVAGQTDVTAGKNIDIELIPEFTVIFNVKNQGVPVANANVIFNSSTKQTATDGSTTFGNVLYGNGYTYTVNLTGYHDATGLVDVTENKNINVEFTPVGVLVPDANKNYLSVWPNPFSSNINIEFNLEKPAYINLSLYFLDGRMISNLASGWYQDGPQYFSNNKVALNSGTYIIRLQVDKKTFSQIIQHIP